MVKKFIIENFLGGINPNSKYYGENVYQAGIGINPFQRDEEMGDTATGWGSTQLGAAIITTTIGQMVPTDVSGDGQKIYAYSPTKIYQINASTGVVSDNATYPLTITNGAVIGGMMYFKSRMLYGNGNTQIGIFTPGATPAQTDAQFTGFGSSTRRPMAQGFETAYIANGNQIATITDPTSGSSLNLNALDLPTGFLISDIEFWDDKIFIAGTEDTTSNASIPGAVIYLWDGFSESWFAEYKLPEPYIRNLKIFKGVVVAQGAEYLYSYTGNGFQPFYYVGSGITSRPNLVGRGVEAGSLDLFKQFLIYPNSDGDLVTIGSLNPGETTKVAIPFKAPTAEQQNAILVVGEKIWYSLANNTLYTFSAGSNQTSITLSTKEFVFASPVHFVGMRVNFQRLASGDSMTVNMINASDGASTAVGTITFASDGGSVISKYLMPSADVRVSAFHLNFVFNAGSLALKPKVTVYYQEIPEPYHVAV